MAIPKQFKCRKCGNTTTLWCKPGDYPTHCFDCTKSAADDKKAAWMSMRATLPLEERIALLESFEYDHGLVKHGYIPEPRF